MTTQGFLGLFIIFDKAHIYIYFNLVLVQATGKRYFVEYAVFNTYVFNRQN